MMMSCQCPSHNRKPIAYTPSKMPSEERLDELHYKDLMGEVLPNNVAGARNNKLPFRDWAPLVPSVEYDATRKNTMKFLIPGKYNDWETYIQFVEWNEMVADESVNAAEAARLLFWGANLRVHCGCPSYSFWGFQYILTQMDSAIMPETRYPSINNPELKGIVCKHLMKTLKVLPFHLGDMAKEIKLQRARRAAGMPEPAIPDNRKMPTEPADIPAVAPGTRKQA